MVFAWWMVKHYSVMGICFNNIFIITAASRYHLSCNWLQVLYYNFCLHLGFSFFFIHLPGFLWFVFCSTQGIWSDQTCLTVLCFFTWWTLSWLFCVFSGLRARMVHWFCHCCNVWFKTEYTFNVFIAFWFQPIVSFLFLSFVFVFCLAFSLLCCFWRWVSGFVQFAQRCL